MVEDAELLRTYAREKSEAAFTELVRRHLNLVYAVALRQVGGDAHLAEDVAQLVFAALARKAHDVAARPALSGWLYRSTHFAASDLVRSERRRKAREQEAHMRNEINAAPASVVEWERVRPTLDAAIAELDDADRDAVALRFFDGRPFAEVGTNLRLTENAARMRVDRALDKLHAELAKRGVTSTSAALAVALAHQAGGAAPAGLAASVTGAALAGTAGGVATATGAGAFMGTTKIVTGLAVVVAIAALGGVVLQRAKVRAGAAALDVAEQEQAALRDELAAMETKLRQAEKRAAEAERDNGELLKAVEAVRARQAAAKGNAAVGVAFGERSPPTEAERLASERAYQQDLAKRRAAEARAGAELAAGVSRADPVQKFNLLVNEAEQSASRAEFQAAIRLLNQAMSEKPAGWPVPERVQQLQAMLKAQSTPVDVILIADGTTYVSITGHRMIGRSVGPSTVKILPGDYEIVGRRQGYEDVRIPLRVRNDGSPPPVVEVACTVPTRR